MINLFPEADQLKYPIFKLFNQNYGDIMVSICPLLTKFQVRVYTVDEYLALPQEIPKIEDIHDQSFASVVFKYQESAESTFAGIVYNKPLINKLCFTKDEQYAAISHEIGHILYFFLEDKGAFPGTQGEEIYADRLSTLMGLTDPMLSCIKKMKDSGCYSDSLSRFGMRELILSSHIFDS